MKSNYVCTEELMLGLSAVEKLLKTVVENNNKATEKVKQEIKRNNFVILTELKKVENK